MSTPSSDVSRLLLDWSDGDADARDQLMPLVFDELHAIAKHQYDMERPGHTLQPTALVGELYLRLQRQNQVKWHNRREFFAVAARLIRRILVDHARKRQAVKRGSGGPKVVFDEALGLPSLPALALVALDDAIEDLCKVDERGGQVVELHAFGGLTFDEIAETLGVGRATVLRDWRHARLWLRRYLSHVSPQDDDGSGS
ncbi:MAG: ECF-type sigma factor [Acidobacteriota bacterium]